MKKRLFYLLSYLGLWLLFFVVLKFIFLGYHYKETSELSIFYIINIIRHGILLDLSFSAYISALPFLLISLSVVLPIKTIQKILKLYTLIIAIFISTLTVIDLELYKAWGFRLDATPLSYLNTPREMWASSSASPVILLAFILVLCVFLLYFSYVKWVNPFITAVEKPSIVTLPIFLLLTAALVIPIRGGFQLAPINVSEAYFSENNFANQAAINVPWNFFNDLSRKTYDKKNPYTFMNEEVAKETLKTHFDFAGGSGISILNTKTPNVLIIIWESFTAKATHSLGKKVDITPNFDALVDEGLLFSNFFATADRSDKGLVGILSGYPAQPTQSIIKQPTKSSKLPILSKTFEAAGYSTSFYYGGELEFANIKSYLMNGGFDKVIGKSDFDSEDWNSKWGAHDHVVLNKVLQDLKETSKPFFTTVFTLSSHEPFEVPIQPVIKGDDEESRFLNSLHYTDQSVGDFIERIKKETWYDETLVIILADHGHRLPKSSKNFEKEKFHIPMLWLGGALTNSDSVISTYSSQVDLAATLLNQLSIPSKEYLWSRDILDSSYTPFAQFVFNDGFGHVSPRGYMAYDNNGKRFIHRDSDINTFEVEFSKAYLQVSFQDFLDK